MQLKDLKNIDKLFNEWKSNKSEKELSYIQPRNLAIDLKISEEDADNYMSYLVDNNKALRIFTGICPGSGCNEEFCIDSSQANERYECPQCECVFKVEDDGVRELDIYYDLIDKECVYSYNPTGINYRKKYFSSMNNKNISEIENRDNNIIEITKANRLEENNNDSNSFKIFISHNEKNADLADIIIELLEDLGVSKSVEDKKIFCSSATSRGVAMGEDIFEVIKEKFDENIIVFFLFTKEFYESPACICEMGATWVKTKKHFPLVMPPYKFEDIKGIINKMIKGYMLDDENKFSELVDYLKLNFKIKEPSYKDYERIKNKYFKAINTYKKEHNISE